MGTYTIVEASVEDVYAAGLIRLLDADIRSRYPGEPVNGIDPESFRAAGGCFAAARLAGTDGSQLIGCGAFRPFDGTTVEVKRMFVHPDHRGRGVARAILAALEAEARRRGFTRAILETGNKQFEAIALYHACGYDRIDVFGQYAGDPKSVCFGKDL
jgi:GNAT superfamily N-acetyltransferase